MLQEQQPPCQLTALAVVIESSLAIAQEWPTPLFHYCMHLFKRISDAHHPAKLRGAFVGYGTADTVPSPILCKRFFTENTMVFKEIFEEPMHFGIGMTSSGGTRGVAALEGLVAALEMFDDLHKLPNSKICGSFILHIAASAPDNSLRPEWNDSELTDDMTWESLPVEFKKRNIAYNLLTIRPPQGRLAELYAAMNTGTEVSPPWFELRSMYTLSAASIVSLQPVKVINKRQNEIPAATEGTLEKRPRLQHTAHESRPKSSSVQPLSEPLTAQTPETIPSTQSQTLPQPQMQPQPATLHVAQPAASSPSQIPNVPLQQIGSLTPEEFMARFSTATEVMRKYEATIKASIAAGDMERAELIRAEYEKKKPQYEKMGLMFRYYRQMSARSQSSAKPPNDVGVSRFPVGGGDNVPPVNSNSAFPPQVVANSEMAMPPTDVQMNETHLSSNPVATNTSLSNALSNPNINLQMQKMMEQRQLQHELGSNISMSGVGMQNSTPAVVSLPHTNGESAGIPTGPRLMAPGSAVEWTGTLKWSGQGPNGMREMQCVVSVASALAPEKAYSASWPKTLELIPVDKIPMIQLQEWIKKQHQHTCLCSFKALLTESDQASYAVLMQLLDSVYAVASWTLPSGTQPTRNAIFFTYHQRTASVIAGALFPLMGIPELPKAIPLPHPGHPPANIPQNMIQTLKSMSPSERQQVMSQWLMHQNRLRQQQVAHLTTQQSSSFNSNMEHPPANQANFSSALDASGGPSQGNFIMNHNSQSQGGLRANTAAGPLGSTMAMSSAPTTGIINYEVLQSMMQRNASNRMSLGQNMGPKTS